MATATRKVQFDKGSAVIETFDPQAVKGLLGTGNLVLLIGIAPDGYMTVFKSPDNPIKHVDGEPVETSTGHCRPNLRSLPPYADARTASGAFAVGTSASRARSPVRPPRHLAVEGSPPGSPQAKRWSVVGSEAVVPAGSERPARWCLSLKSGLQLSAPLLFLGTHAQGART